MQNNVLYLGVMGYSGQKFDSEKARTFVNEAFDRIYHESDGREIRVVSGYTNLGIPALAYEEAVRRGWRTVGIACLKAKEYEVFPCDEVYLEGEKWGDESPKFLAKCEVFVRVGGGNQSHREANEAKASGKPVLEYELEVINS